MVKRNGSTSTVPFSNPRLPSNFRAGIITRQGVVSCYAELKDVVWSARPAPTECVIATATVVFHDSDSSLTLVGLYTRRLQMTSIAVWLVPSRTTARLSIRGRSMLGIYFEGLLHYVVCPGFLDVPNSPVLLTVKNWSCCRRCSRDVSCSAYLA